MRSESRGRAHREAIADRFHQPDQWKGSDVVLCGPEAALEFATRSSGRRTRETMQATLALCVPWRRGAPRSRGERIPPARASRPAAKMSGCRRVGSPQHRPRVWRQLPPAHRALARAPSTPMALRWEDAEWCRRRAGGRLLQPVPPCPYQNGGGAGMPDSSRHSAESAARSEDNSMPHPLAPWILTV